MRVERSLFATPRILRSTGTSSSVTGTTSETQLGSIIVPANALGANGKLRVCTTWVHSANANNKTLRVRFGGAFGTAYLANVVTSTQQTQAMTMIFNTNATGAQRGFAPTTAGFGSSNTSPPTSSVDTTVDQEIYISGQLADGADTIWLMGYVVEIIPGVSP